MVTSRHFLLRPLLPLLYCHQYQDLTLQYTSYKQYIFEYKEKESQTNLIVVRRHLPMSLSLLSVKNRQHNCSTSSTNSMKAQSITLAIIGSVQIKFDQRSVNKFGFGYPLLNAVVSDLLSFYQLAVEYGAFWGQISQSFPYHKKAMQTF